MDPWLVSPFLPSNQLSLHCKKISLGLLLLGLQSSFTLRSAAHIAAKVPTVARSHFWALSGAPHMHMFIEVL